MRTSDDRTIVCNPIDLPYRVQNTSVGLGSKGPALFREAADPSVVRFKGRYFLFASMSGGFWHSTDLADWAFEATPALPTHDYAPDVREVDGRLVVCASRRGRACDFYRTANPLGGDWEVIRGTTAFWDPNLFQDDDGRLFLYEGCSANRPIRGVELDRETFRYLGKPIDLIGNRSDRHGWERPGPDWDSSRLERPLFMRAFFGRRPFIEGAWMTKRAGRYYLQYAAPGTECNTYSDGYYVGDSPLGPFTYGVGSPFSSKPGGFITGAGHGSTFEDEYGNWWHMASMRISKHHDFERRLGLFPVAFDDDGVMSCNQEFADYPFELPHGPADPWSLSGTQMLLSAGRPVTASSSAPGHDASLAATEDVRTWWKAATSDPGQWVQVELAEGVVVTSIQVNSIEDLESPPMPERATAAKELIGRRHLNAADVAVPFVLTGSLDGETWTVLRDGTNDGRPHDFTVVDDGERYRYIRAIGGTQPYGGAFAVSGLRVFGHGAGRAPDPVAPSAVRIDDLTARVSWDAVDHAQGYNVRYGLGPTALTHCWQVEDAVALVLRSLSAGLEYWVAVDSFDENGVTRGVAVPIASAALVRS